MSASPSTFRVPAALVVLVVLVVASPRRELAPASRAQPGPTTMADTSAETTTDTTDFSGAIESWNGVGYLIETALEARVTLQVSTQLDLATLAPGDLVLAVQPASTPAPTDLRAFIDAGGHMIIAAEGEPHRRLFAAFGLTLTDAPAAAANTAETPGIIPLPAPVGTGARPRSDARDPASFLFFNVKHLTTNYPAAITTTSPLVRPVLSYPGAPDHHLIVEVPVGRGSVVFISDASLFINHMLRRHYGNKQFAANALRFFCDREPCQAHLLPGDAAFHGVFNADLARFGPFQRALRDAIHRTDLAIRHVSRHVFAGIWPFIALAFVLALIPTLRLASRRTRQRRLESDRRILGTSAPAPSPPLETALGFAAHRGAAEFGPLALSLADLAVHRSARLPHRQLPPIVEGALERLRRDAETLRARHAQGVSAEHFVRLHSDVETVLDYLRPRRATRPEAAPTPREKLSST